VRAFTDAELSKLLDGASEKLSQAVLIAAYTGARASGVASLEYDEVRELLHIKETKTKTSARTIPCPRAIRKTVKAWIESPWKTTTISNRFNERKTALGFTNRTECFHSLRHTFVTRMHELGVPEATVAALVGHKHKSITFGRYGDRVDVETLRVPINRLRYTL
jgi:integrase